jgi:16S rRNA G966 N2-methylase RsmD
MSDQTNLELAFRFLYEQLVHVRKVKISADSPWHCYIKTSAISSSALAQILSVLLSDLPLAFSDTDISNISQSIIYTDNFPADSAAVIIAPEHAMKGYKATKGVTKTEQSFVGIDGDEQYSYLWFAPEQLKKAKHEQKSSNILAQLTRPDIFPPVDSSNHPVPLYTVSFTSEALYSATPLKANELMTIDIIERLKGFFPNRHLIVADGTANCGADTIGCLYHSRKLKRPFDMISIELNELNFECLESNVLLFGYNDEVESIHGNTLEWISWLKDTDEVDVMYFDPPWGGKDYKQEKEVRLKLGDISIWNVAADALKNVKSVKLIVIKAPFNFDKNEVSFQAVKNRCEIKSYPVSKNIVYIFVQ